MTPASDPDSDNELTLDLDGVSLEGRFADPRTAFATVVFAHGSGSSRHSPRNLAVADRLNQLGFATLLFDLLTPPEAVDRANVFDIELLGGRLVEVVRWVAGRHPGRPTGLFGASTGGAAALYAAAEPGEFVSAVVVRGGRPDLTGPRLGTVRSPTLLIVGGADPVVLDLNRAAAEHLNTTHDLLIVPGAGHLFEGPGEMRTVAELAGQWFLKYLIDAE